MTKPVSFLPKWAEFRKTFLKAETWLVALFLLAFLAVHPYGPLAGIGDFADDLASQLGLRIYFQPFTYDMTHVPEGRHRNDAWPGFEFYESRLQVNLLDEQGHVLRQVDLDTMPFHAGRAPFLRYFERYFITQARAPDLADNAYALCRGFAQIGEPGFAGFEFRLTKETSTLMEARFPCR